MFCQRNPLREYESQAAVRFILGWSFKKKKQAFRLAFLLTFG
jgi:hypothetical protein